MHRQDITRALHGVRQLMKVYDDVGLDQSALRAEEDRLLRKMENPKAHTKATHYQPTSQEIRALPRAPRQALTETPGEHQREQDAFAICHRLMTAATESVIGSLKPVYGARILRLALSGALHHIGDAYFHNGVEPRTERDHA